MRNFSDKEGRKKSTHILCSVKVPENRAIYGVMWKKIM